MSTLSRTQFVDTLRSSTIDVRALDVTDAQKAQLQKADLNRDGVVRGEAELKKLFERMDTFDVNGSYGSVDTSKAPIARMATAIAVAAGKPRTSLRGPKQEEQAPSSAPSGAVTSASSRAEKLAYAKDRARELGLTITSTTGGRHAPGSYHYSGRAADVAGAPATMAKFYREMAKLNPTELFYDPIGGMKYGKNIGAIGGHGDHVHVAF